MFQSDLKYLRPLITSYLASNAPTEIRIKRALNILRQTRTALPIVSSERLRHVDEIRIKANSVSEKPRIML
jgi:hypothetical protein